jgi:hypothetical protein
MRLVFACVLGWFVIAAAALASHGSGAPPPAHPRHDRSGSLIVALGAPDRA